MRKASKLILLFLEAVSSTSFHVCFMRSSCFRRLSCKVRGFGTACCGRSRLSRACASRLLREPSLSPSSRKRRMGLRCIADRTNASASLSVLEVAMCRQVE